MKKTKASANFSRQKQSEKFVISLDYDSDSKSQSSVSTKPKVKKGEQKTQQDLKKVEPKSKITTQKNDSKSNPILSESSEELYVMEKIIDKSIKKGQIHYLVKWKNFPNTDNTWEPRKNLIEDNCQNLIEEYENSVLQVSKVENKNNKIIVNNKFQKNKSDSVKEVEEFKINKKIKKQDMQDLSSDETINDQFSKSDTIENPQKEQKSDNSSLVNSEQKLEKNQKLQSSDNKSNSNAKSEILKIEKIKEKKDMSKGSYDNEDLVSSIMSIKKTEEGSLQYKVKWQTRKDGFTPEISNINSEEMKQHQPKIVFDFYESKMKFVSSG